MNVERKQLGKTKETITELGLGSWKLGSEIEAEALNLDFGFDSGINFVDTAEMYGTEPIVGRAVKDRADIFVATKVSPTHFRYDDVIRSCDASLQRLGVKTIDLYQLHWPNATVPIKETMRAMEKLVKDGKVRHIGVSNFSVGEVREAQGALSSNEIVSNQVEYNVLVRDVEKELLDFCKNEKITIIAYSPLARGMFFNKKYSKLLMQLEKIGQKYHKNPAQVALNWLTSHEGVVAIPKASSREHVKEIVDASGWRLSKEDIASINTFLLE